MKHMRKVGRIVKVVAVVMALMGLLLAWPGAALAQEGQVPPAEIVSAGRLHTCALTPSGAVDCWGDNDYGQADDQPGPYTQVSAGLYHTCALTPSGAVDCWGYNNHGQADDQPGPYTQVNAGYWHTCALTPGGAVECWGNNSDGQAADQPGPYTQVSTGGYHTCALTLGGAVDCWGAEGNDYGQAADQPGPYTQVSAGYWHTCALTLGGAVECWGNNFDGQAAHQPGPYTQVSAGGYYTCALTLGGAVDCWGANNYGQADDLPGPYTQVSAGYRHTCALTPSGAVDCWGLNDFGQADDQPGPYGPYDGPPETFLDDTPADPSYGGVSFTFSSDDPGATFECRLDAGEWAACSSPKVYIVLALGGHTFEVRATDAAGIADASPASYAWTVAAVEPAPPGIVGAGTYHTCALTPSGAVDCWGRNDYGQAADQPGPYTQVSVGRFHTCALTPSGAVDCWGNNEYGQAAGYPGPYTQVSAGAGHTCALTPSGAVDCWGYDYYGQAADQPGPYTQVSAGIWHTCALTPAGAVDCWGWNDYGQADDQPGPYTQVSAGGYHTCALTPSGAVDCWGNNYAGQADDQLGPYTQVNAGGYHTCALTPSGAVDCWGDNYDGQAADQPGPYGPYMPATIVVTSNADSGPGTLRQAIADVADGGTITFGGDMTIHLASTLTLGRDVTIDGAGHSVTTSGDSNGDGTGDVRVFYVNSGVTAALEHLTVTKGHANNGGGVYSDGALTVTNCTFAGNSATYGGGIHSLASGGLTVKNCTFAGNSAAYGGGIHSKFGTVRNCTFSDNSAVSGSAIFKYEGGMLAARNSIMVGSGPLCQDVSGADNLSSDGSCIGSSPSNILLGPLGDYGGGTQTIPLLPGSAAIDTGNPAICLATDQRGLARVGTCDIGAFESQGFALGDLTGTPQSMLVNTAFAQPLGLTVAANDPLEPVDGGLVTFTTPAEGANAVLSADMVTISGAAASVTATANGTAGSYDVTAEAKGAASVPFALTNTLPVLALDAISPASAVAGSGDLSLAVTGSGFIDGSVVRWNGADLETTIAGETQLNALVPSGSLAAVQTAQVTVYTPWGGSSQVLAFFVTQAAAGVSGQDVVDGNNPAATYGPASAAATGEGLLAVAQYDANPGGTPSFTASGTYFDVYAAPGNTFTQVTIVACGLSANDKLFWWDTGQAKWQKASPQSYDPSTSCVTLVVDGSSSPTLSQLQGTFFASGNTAPTANPGGPYLGAINTAILFDGSFSSDADSDFLTYAWTFGDGGSATEAMPTHGYTAAGIYDVCLTVNDSTMDSDPACTLAVVYDPEGGFVTGGGWIDSPAGAYRLDPNLSGKATFGFVSKYKKGTTVPEGNTEFQFQAGGFNFHSTAYDWLVVEGKTRAQFKGSGTVNDGLDPNENAYRFMLWAGDGAASGGSDTFRIRIWWEDANAVEYDVYDNGFNQAIGGGSIVIHTK